MHEYEFTRWNMPILFLFEEANTGYIYPTSLRIHRGAMQAIVSKIRDGGGSGDSETNLAEAFPDIRDRIAEMLEALLEGDTRWLTGDSIPMGVGMYSECSFIRPSIYFVWGGRRFVTN